VFVAVAHDPKNPLAAARAQAELLARRATLEQAVPRDRRSDGAAILEQHGGTMAVESRDGDGTTFVVHLPVGAETDGHPGEESADADAPERAWR
jgi:signal transduction histidine kinase